MDPIIAQDVYGDLHPKKRIEILNKHCGHVNCKKGEFCKDFCRQPIEPMKDFTQAAEQYANKFKHVDQQGKDYIVVDWMAGATYADSEAEKKIDALKQEIVGLKHTIAIHEDANTDWRNIVKRKNEEIERLKEELQRVYALVKTWHSKADTNEQSIKQLVEALKKVKHLYYITPNGEQAKAEIESLLSSFTEHEQK